MRIGASAGVIVALALVTGAGVLCGAQVAKSDQVAILIRQLGNESFAKREAASKELARIGEPAQASLREAAFGSDDPEIRKRAEHLIQTTQQLAAKKEMAKWEGSWEAAGGLKLTIKGDRFTSSAPGIGPRNGWLLATEVREKVLLVDFLVEEGDLKGQTARGILRLEGATLHYCVTYNDARPKEFKTADQNYHVAWKRVPK